MVDDGFTLLDDVIDTGFTVGDISDFFILIIFFVILLLDFFQEVGAFIYT